MTPDPADAPLDPMTEQALAWLVRLHSGSQTAEDWSDYQAWKTANAEQRRAAVLAERLWERLGPALKPRRRSKVRGMAIALALTAGLTGIGFSGGVFGPPAAYFADQRTSIGERRTMTLADGSTMELDAGTSVDIDFGPDRRRLVLHTGQIFVTVAPDPARPFVVHAGRGSTRALGTAFDVRSEGEGARIVVTEHAVRVAYPGADASVTVDVRAGQQVVYAPGPGLGRPEPVDTAMLTAWRRGQVIFDGRPLGDVVGAMARYRRGRILITDSALRDLPVTGIFSTADTDALLDALPAILPVRVWRLPGLAVIQRDADRPAMPFQRVN
ncbi:FecR family protein [Phreatobacter stygius]|uniref:FecR family protein n=1 Tax=Phreatobacter stygius TaxID=1940610 RepID=A0A4D7ASR9_9HYPH|nr:FecR family protein [Phreatobacter stygius]QCI64544.1 FecR family protein [Phreatobacter stygius]